MLYNYQYLEDEWSKLFWNVIIDNIQKDIIQKDNIQKDINWYYVWNNESLNYIQDYQMINKDKFNYYWYNIKNVYNKNININLDWFKISSNDNITWEIITSNIDKPWRWDGISQNININWEIVQNNKNLEWCWPSLLNNPMTIGKYNWMNELRIKTIKANKIQKI